LQAAAPNMRPQASCGKLLREGARELLICTGKAEVGGVLVAVRDSGPGWRLGLSSTSSRLKPHTETRSLCANAGISRHFERSPIQYALETDWLAEVVGLELRNVGANYPFERSHRFAGIQPNSGHRDYSRLSCGVG
jgi:hypothetical protein